MKKITLDTATKFVVLLGLVSLFGDMTYEAARSINGSFLKILGANGTTVGIAAGLGELAGYGLRFVSGYIADRTKKYWTIMIIGYLLNLFSVPLMALAGYWQIAVVLIIAERVGKALRTPARDAILSFGTQKMGRGWGYGLHEAMDQIGATIGPLLVSLVLLLKNQNYELAYAILAIPAIIAFMILILGVHLYPKPGELEIKTTSIVTKGVQKRFWIYIIAVVFIAAGYADFPLIAFHFKSKALMSDSVIPIFYAIAMAVDAVAALVFGKIYDRKGINILLLSVLISCAFAPLVFYGNFYLALFGMILWGIGMGAQESILKAEIANMVSTEKRGRAFGTFNAIYGLSWFAGSALMGIFYDFSIKALVIFSVTAQIIAAGVILYMLRYNNRVSE
ncbi:MAG TPA: MFS transporter [Bacteroidales bacterium]|nr:MFS transporter [Bacteroidales bacterium]HOU95290.1 MFS transporter [Bacteroidales bacterium]HQG35626.1 MFS transporter [Bacteroidales bacterium]HQG51936.1 MFS transporter [Bacteroidales bacterium]HQJ19632.1 MFS transporter [Bacteroidales bacterium]